VTREASYRADWPNSGRSGQAFFRLGSSANTNGDMPGNRELRSSATGRNRPGASVERLTLAKGQPSANRLSMKTRQGTDLFNSVLWNRRSITTPASAGIRTVYQKSERQADLRPMRGLVSRRLPAPMFSAGLRHRLLDRRFCQVSPRRSLRRTV